MVPNSCATKSGGVVVDWSTSTETINIGFNIYAHIDGERVIINDALIQSHNGDSVEPQYYEAVVAVPVKAIAAVVHQRLHPPKKVCLKNNDNLPYQPNSAILIRLVRMIIQMTVRVVVVHPTENVQILPQVERRQKTKMKKIAKTRFRGFASQARGFAKIPCLYPADQA